ncbi:MAG: aldo/keto reductase [Bacillota bacterium]
MRYRTFGRLDWKASALGFGAMRLPVLGDDPARIDEDKALAMVRYAIDHGVNYVDTAYPYHGGRSEGFVGKALAGGYREKVKVATKSPTWLLEKTEDFDRYLDEQLERLQAGPIDFYLLHSLSRERWPKMKELDVIARAERALADGRIKHFGFSFHDGLECFKEIINSYDGWEFCQIQYNYIDTDFQAGTTGLRYAAEKGLGVIVMEPVRGGSLASPPEAVRRALDATPIRKSPAEWALQWVWNHPEVSLVLSGMSTLEQVKKNVEAASSSGPGHLTAEELAAVDAARREWLGTGWVPCTACGYCLPCPHGLHIPDNFDIYNRAVVQEDRRPRLRDWYSRWPEERRAGSCQACAECETKCPQQLPIAGLLVKVEELLGGAPQTEATRGT